MTPAVFLLIQVLPELIEEIETKMEEFEKNSSDYEKLFAPKVMDHYW